MLKTPRARTARRRRRPGPPRNGTAMPRAAAHTRSRCCSRARCPTLVQRELERMILAGELAAGAKLNEATSPSARACRAGRCARRSARSRNRGSSASRRIAACSCARSASRKRTRSSSCAPCSTSSPAGASAQNVEPERRRATCATLVEPHGQGRGARRPRRVPRRQPRVPRPAGRARRQCEAARTVSAPGQRADPVPARDARAGRATCRCRRASIATIVERIAAGQAAAAGRLLHDHVHGEPRAHASAIGADAASPPARRGTAPRGRDQEIALNRCLRHRQRPHLPLARAPAGRRLRRRLRARLHQPGDRRRQRAVARVRCAAAAPASPPIASCRRSPIRTTCRSSPARRRRCTASAATTSGTATRTPK